VGGEGCSVPPRWAARRPKRRRPMPSSHLTQCCSWTERGGWGFGVGSDSPRGALWSTWWSSWYPSRLVVCAAAAAAAREPVAPMVGRAAHRSECGLPAGAGPRPPDCRPPRPRLCRPRGTSTVEQRTLFMRQQWAAGCGHLGSSVVATRGYRCIVMKLSGIKETIYKRSCPRWGGRTTRTHDLQITEGDHMRLTLCQLSYKDGGGRH